MINVHCMSHHTNLVVQTLFELSIVGKIEDVLKWLYAFFFHNQKIIHEYVELINIVETKFEEHQNLLDFNVVHDYENFVWISLFGFEDASRCQHYQPSCP
jgi:hypothetical protein